MSRTILIVAALAFVASASVYGYYSFGTTNLGGKPSEDIKKGDEASGKPTSSEYYATGGEAFEMRFDDALLVCESGSLRHGTKLSVGGIDADLPPLGAGMVNVTSGHAGYRFLPHGEHFRKAAGIQIGYDEAKLPKGYSHKDIYTYYYDEGMKVWKRLQRDSVSGGIVYSRTTHFTDMINAVVSHPEMPEGQSFTPTGLKELKAADPAAGVTLAEVSAGNSQGELTARYPIELPQGRRGMQPDLTIGYSSGGGDGLLGVGWDMRTSAISVDSRWGVPRYDMSSETESYVIDGEELLPSPRYQQQWEPRHTAGAKVFWRRTESSYDKIERHGTSPQNYYWIVTDKGGTKYYYGTYAGYALADTVLMRDAGGNISHWPLCRVEDADGNYISYHYNKRRQYDAGGVYLGRQLWLESIEYTGNSRTGERGVYNVFFGSTANPCRDAAGGTGTDLSGGSGEGGGRGASGRSRSGRSVAVSANLCDPLSPPGTCMDLLVEVLKYDKRSGNLIPGAVFELSDLRGVHGVWPATTDASGEASWDVCIQQGDTIVIREISAPGYCNMVDKITLRMPSGSTTPQVLDTGSDPGKIKSIQATDHHIIIEIYNDECDKCECPNVELNIEKYDATDKTPMPGVEFRVTYGGGTHTYITGADGKINAILNGVLCDEVITVNEQSVNGYCDSLHNFQFRMHKDEPYEPCTAEIISQGDFADVLEKTYIQGNGLTLILKDHPCVKCECSPVQINIIKTEAGTGRPLAGIPFEIVTASGTHTPTTDGAGVISLQLPTVECGSTITINELHSAHVCAPFKGYEFHFESTGLPNECEPVVTDQGPTGVMIKNETAGVNTLHLEIENDLCGGGSGSINADSIENIYIGGKEVPDFYLGMDLCDCDREYPKTDRNEARSGHLQSQRDKLRRILVYYGDEMVRSYSFCYGEDIHGMAQLRKIRQWGRDYSDGSRDHDIEYYREIDADSLLGTATTTMTTADYGLGGLLGGAHGKLRKPIERSLSGVLGTRTVIGGNASLSFGGDAGVYAGVGANTSSKINSVSYSLGADYGLGYGSSTLCDVDGDGLPDRLLVINGGLHWQRQQNGAFLTPSPISGAGNYLRDSRVSVSHGPVLNVAGISGGVSWSTTTTTTGTYLSDMDGDGLPDIVDDSRISRLGGRYNAPSMTMPGGCGTPTVTPDATPKYPCVEPLGLDEIPDAESSIDEESPHYDIIRIWESEDIPHTTILSIDAKAWLGGLVRNAEERPDTVVLSVEYYGQTYMPKGTGSPVHVLIAIDTLTGTDTLWRGDLTDPDNGYLSREYIERILEQCVGTEPPDYGEGMLLFRARSKGGRDVSRELHWNPRVQVFHPYRYPTHGQRSEVAGFAMGGGRFVSPGNGQAALRVPTAAADFASAVRLEIRRNNTLMRTLTPGSSPVWDTVITLAEEDSLIFDAIGDTSTVWKDNQWHPYLYYKTLTAGGGTVTTMYFDTLAGGVVDTIKTLEYHIVPNYRCYRAGSPKYHLSTASLPFGHGFGGWHAVQYRHDDSIKINLAKLFSISNMPSSATDLNTYYGNLTDSNYLKQLSDTTTTGTVGDVLSLFGCMPLTGNGERRRMEGIYPNAYVSGPAISLGVMTDTLLPNVAGNTIPCGQSSGGGDRAYRTSGGSTGSRATAAGGGKLDKISKSKNFSYTVALYSAGNGRTWMERDVTDLNGDGRPDIIDGGGVYYTKPYHILSYESAAYRPFGGGHPYSGTGNSRSVVLPGQFLNTSKQTTSSGRGRDFVLSPGASKASDSTYRTLADLNGDGLPDIVCSDGTVRLGTGYGFLPQQQWPGLDTVSASLSLSASASGTFSIWNNAISGGVGVTTASNTQTVFLQDMDGDGLPDLVRRNFADGEIQYRRNTGSAFAAGWTAWRTPDILANLAEYGTSTSASTNIEGTGGWSFWLLKAGGSAGLKASMSLSNEKLQISDMDGDGVADLLKSESGTEIAVRYSRMGRTGLLKSITNPLGGTIYADYELTAPTVYHQRRWVARELKICDGLPGDGRDTLRTTYSYSHGYYDRDEKAFLGFAKVTETRWNGDTVHSTADKYFSNSDIHTKGIPVASFLRNSRGLLYVQTANTLQQETLDVIGDAERVFPYITRSQTCYYEGQPTAGIVKWQETDYDFGNGNVVLQRHGSTDQPTVEVEIAYHPQYNGNHIVNKVQRVEIQGMRLRTTDIDTLGHYTAIMDYDGQNTLATRYVFDIYGNITDVRGPNTAVHYTYDGDVHTYPESVTDTFGTSSQMQNYDLRYGVPLTVTDRAGNSMEYTLDSWGRPLTIRGPKEIADGAPYTIRYTYRGKETARNVSSATTENYDPQHPANPIKTHTYCDGLGRAVQTRVEAEVQGVEKLVVSGHTVFDGLGRAVATYHPTEAHRDSTRFAFAVDAITPSTATYDVLDRPLVQTAPDGSTTRTAYGFSGSHLNKTLFRTAVTDPNGHTSTTLKDADGRQWAAKAAGQPWLYCDYSPVGDLLAVYSSNNGDWSRAYEYDWLGRRLSYGEGHLETLYTYDGLNPATETHKWQENGQPKQKTITRRYIANRLDSVIYSDSTLPTVYSYDYAGRVETVFDESGRMDYTYGNMGEVKSETRTYALPFLATDLALTTQYEYDSWGRTTSITYPDGETVSYDYDRGGQLFRMYNVQLTMYNYLDSVLYDKFGAVTSRKYGNGLKMQYAYHPQNCRLTGITTLSGNSQLSHTAYSYDPAGNITQAVSSYPWLAGQTFTETFSYDSTNQLVSAANPQTYALSVTYGDWGKIQEYGLQQTDLNSNTTTSQTRYYSYGSLNEGQTTFAPNNISYADGTNVNEQYGIGGSLQRRETTIPNAQPSEELYRFGADGNLRLYSYDRLFYSLYGYDGGTTRTYKYSMDLSPNWVNGRLEAVNFNLHNAMFYPNSYLNFNSNGYYTKHYYNGMERIASRLGDQNLPINVNDPDLQSRKEWQDSLIRKNIVEITGYEFLEPGEEQNHEDPKPIFELPQIGLTNLIPNTSSVYYYHPNHLGSTCYVTDENAIVQQGFLYAPFGEITNEHNSSFGSSVLPKYSFNAKELDEETGMYYYEARYMAPPVFISRDPHFERYPTFSPYAYCANNPVKYVDPTGEDFEPVVDDENKTITFRAKYYTSKENADDLKKGIHFWNSESGCYKYVIGEGKEKQEYTIKFDLQIEVREDAKKAFENDKSGMANYYEGRTYVGDDKARGETENGNIIRLRATAGIRTMAHEIGHTLGIQHWTDGLMETGGDGKWISKDYIALIFSTAGCPTRISSGISYGGELVLIEDFEKTWKDKPMKKIPSKLHNGTIKNNITWPWVKK
ncbi:MAG: hypothetical protein IJQ89_01280 [Bacteroidales bacterium]|nr:hypothetical protein [Bacteroidales bacterium]